MISSLRQLALFRIRLPFAGVLGALGDRGDTALEARADVGDAVTKGLAEATSGGRDGLADAARRSAHDAANCVGQAADCVTEGRGDELGGAGDARAVVLLVVHVGVG